MDTIRYVSFNIGGRPKTLLDLNDGTFLGYVKNSLTITPPAKTPIMTTADRRYGGSTQVGETTDNGAISFTCMVTGGSQDEATERFEQMLAQLEEPNLGPLFLQVVLDGQSKASFYDVRGTGTWSIEYDWAPWAQNGVGLFKISIPVGPLVRGHQLDILDIFDVDTRADYTYDAGAQANEEVTGGVLKSAANAATEQVAIHTGRAYQYGDQQATGKYKPKATITSSKWGMVLKRTGATTRLEVYVDDNGTNSRLRIDKVIAGVRTNLASTNLGARVSNGTAFWVRGRIEKNTITAEYFTAAPTPMGAPATTNSYALTAGTEQNAFGESVKGYAGRVWTPQSTGAELDEWAAEPFTYRNQTLPAKLSLAGTIPGDAPARMDVTVTPSGGSAAPIWALIGWTREPPGGLAAPPFGILESTAAGNLSGWASEAQANSRGGKALLDKAAASADVYTASWELDPSLLVADAFQGEVAVEIWARVMLSSTIVTPVLTASTRPQDGLNFGSARYTDEWGSGGKVLTTPSSGSEKFRFVRLGTLRMVVDTVRPRVWLLFLEGSVGSGSSGEWGIDYLMALPLMQRACSPSSKANDSGFPKFIASTNETSKLIRSDLSATVAKPPSYGHPDHGLGGSLIEPDAKGSELELLVKLSSLAADDPTSDATTELLSHSATVHAAITPRWYLSRSGS